MGVAEVDTTIAMAALAEKHKNGQLDAIHKQVFYNLKKQSCPVCDLPASLYFQMQKSMLHYAADVDLKYVNTERFNGLDSRYNPKSAPPPVEVVCQGCGTHNHIAYDAPVQKNPWTCSKCWWETVGSKL